MTDWSVQVACSLDDLVFRDDIHAGVDQVELEEFGRILAIGGDEFLETVYTNGERDHCNGCLERLATRFAAKEAATKVLGTGLRGIGPQEIEVVSERSGRPQLRLYGRARDRAHSLGITSMSVSMTHTHAAAVAFVVALVDPVSTTESGVPLRKEGRP